MIELNNDTLPDLPSTTPRRAYDRSRVSPGIVHLSVSNFHRAHQAWYIDRLLALQENDEWGICGVGIVDDRPERLKLSTFPKQDNLYTLSLVPPDGKAVHQVISSIVEYLFAPADPETVLAKLASPKTHIVSLTITEGGYNLDRQGLYQLDTPTVAAELADPEHPCTAFGYIVEGLRRRRAAGLQPFTVLSCDNLRGNGDITRRAVLSHARAVDLALADWIMGNAGFPNSMVDRITPAVLQADSERLNATCGVHDGLPVYAETFAQWVVEDRFCDGRPPLELVGVQMVDDVHRHELAKLRMLNGSHSMLAYPALLANLHNVHDAMDKPLFRHLLDDFMEQDVIVHLEQPEGTDLHGYKNMVLDRFSNRAISDQLERIASDGATKLPVFLGGTFAAVLDSAGDHSRLAFLLACFVRYLGGVDDDGNRFAPKEPHLDAEDMVLARSPDKRDALGMSLLTGFGIQREGAFADCFTEYAEALEREGTLALLARLVYKSEPVPCAS